MSEVATKTELTVSPEIVKTRREAWGNFGEELAKGEFTLQIRTQDSLKKIKLPTKIEDVPEAERILKEVKADAAIIQNERKAITSKFDAVSQRLMEPEKSFAGPLDELSKKIIALKKEEEERKKLEAEKMQAIANCRQHLVELKNMGISRIKNLLSDKVNKCYGWALGEGNTSFDELDMLKDLAMSRLSDNDLAIHDPLNTFSKYVSNEDFVKMCVEILQINKEDFRNDFKNQLDLKFADYATALNNKAEALRQEDIRKQTEAQKIADEKANADIAAKMQTLSTPIEPVVSVATKALKQNFDVDMSETLENSVKVMSAFVANIQLANQKLKVNKWDSFTIGQMKKALAKCKDDDNAFAPAGIIFKVVDKL